MELVDKNELKRALASDIFQLQFPVSEVAHLATRYSYEKIKAPSKRDAGFRRAIIAERTLRSSFVGRPGEGAFHGSTIIAILRSSIPCA
jgi:hypothetical protein